MLGMLLLTGLSFCSSDMEVSPSGMGGTGTGGSMARFAAVGNYLYTVDSRDLKVFDISIPASPQFKNDTQIWGEVETIFPFNNTLFIGSQSGMHIYDVSDPLQPTQLSSFWHATSCDPVVTDGTYAYITLRDAEIACQRGVNQLDVVNVENLTSPYLVKTYPMTGPKGLGIDNNLLFLCDAGLKVYDATDVNNLTLLSHFEIAANDVIPVNGLLMVTADDGLYQFRYENNELTFLSKISILGIE